MIGPNVPAAAPWEKHEVKTPRAKMPTRSSATAATAATATAAARRRGPGGKVLGRSALRAIMKNSIAVEEYLTAAEAATDAAELIAIARTGILLARVIRPLGAGNLEVLLQTGESIRVPIGGSIRFKGRAGSKTDRENCMVTGDVVVIRSAFAAGKFLPGTTAHVARIFERLGAPAPKGFFAVSVSTTEETVDDDEGGWEWDRSAAEAAETAARRGGDHMETTGDHRGTTGADGDGDVDVDAI